MAGTQLVYKAPNLQDAAGMSRIDGEISYQITVLLKRFQDKKSADDSLDYQTHEQRPTLPRQA